ncbi:MAG: phosphoenolpyruvate carboxykinase (GTP) [Elusimicrobiota bacterium]|nr:phosphoenolpyruvate carboxykinase (GTP) [Elusimicrobiota bacterium]
MDIKKIIGKEDISKLERINSPAVFDFLEKYIAHCKPDSVFVSDGSPQDLTHIRNKAIEKGEESPVSFKGQTVHYDNAADQARDNKNTRILVSPGTDLGASINTIDRDSALEDVHSIMEGIMKGKTLIIAFFCLGPENSPFSIPCLQLTDSFYVAHSENILYRQGFDEFVRRGRDVSFFKFVHSSGELDGNNTSRNLDKRRVFIDIEDDTVYSANTQYGGNTIGLKKLAMRLAINKASDEGWLTEHMLVMGINGKGGKTYIAGAYPSLCGKTSTAMLDGESIVGDDIAYLRKVNGKIKAVNVENGMFGIIQGINSKDDVIQWDILNSDGELIVSNILVTDDRKTYWIDHDGEAPAKGRNHSGEWSPGKKDPKGNAIPPSHPNARFTVSLERLPNVDENLHNPDGVTIGGIVYGGRDSDTSVPIEQSFDWVHGVITKGAALESETTAAALGKEGVRVFNPMSNLEFLSVPLGKYIKANLEFGQGVGKTPVIFGANYFIRGKEGSFLNEKNDKKVWLKWIEKRINGEAGAIKRPTGLIPEYKDLALLFAEVLGIEYTKDAYEKQFMLRVRENIAKIDRVTEIYSKFKDIPGDLETVLSDQKRRLEKVLAEHGEYVSPFTKID